MAHQKTERNPLFAGRWFDDDIIRLCLRWYFRFKLSYRDLVAILGERGLSISHTTILRWVVRYAETCEKRWSRFERQVGGSWRVDETFIKPPRRMCSSRISRTRGAGPHSSSCTAAQPARPRSEHCVSSTRPGNRWICPSPNPERGWGVSGLHHRDDPCNKVAQLLIK